MDNLLNRGWLWDNLRQNLESIQYLPGDRNHVQNQRREFPWRVQEVAHKEFQAWLHPLCQGIFKSLNRFLKDAIQKVPENFTNNDFFTKREEISRVMSDKVNKVFRENYGEAILFLITDVQLDSSFESSIEQQVIDVLQGQISVIQSNYSSQVAQIQADTQLSVRVLNETAQSLGVSRVIEAQRVGYDSFQSQAGFTGSQIL